jgi:hypothetical protein
MILFNNGLSYQLPVPTSVVTNKVKKRSYFQNRSYDSQQTMVCTWSSASDYIDAANSNLVVKVKVLPGALPPACSFGKGSAMNICDNIRVYHRSGTQYTNTQKINAYRAVEDRMCESENWFSSVGSSMGYDLVQGYFGDVGFDEHLFVIPLKKVHPFFDGSSALLPSAMVGALRVEIDLATVGNIFKVGNVAGTAAPVDYEITSVYFDLESVTLMDSAQASLNSKAQKESLEYLYTDIFTSRNSTPSLTSSVNIDINKSVSYCQKALALIQRNDYQNTTAEDSFVTPYLPGSWWFQLGSMQYPSNQKIDDTRIGYNSALTAWDKHKGRCGERGETAITYSDFRNNTGLYAISAELDTSLALSGQPVTSSRTLRFELSLDTPMANDSTTIVFMTYLSSARSTLTSSKVDI